VTQASDTPAQAIGDDVVPVAVRVWATPTTRRGRVGRARQEYQVSGEAETRLPKRRYPHEALIFDTETRHEAGQRLLVGVWRLYRDDVHTGTPGTRCIEEGLFYPDDLPDRDQDVLSRYAAAHQADVAPGCPPELQLRPLSWWLEERLYRYGDQHRDRCAIVGFNLPFDLGTLAEHWSPAQGTYQGGWSLGLWGEFDNKGKWHETRYHRRLLARAIDPRRTLFGWGSRTDSDKPQLRRKRRFVDLRTLVFALTDGSHTLESACAAFGDPFEKPNVRYGVINKRMLRYARKDVAHTAILYRNCLTELARHPGVDLPPHALYSPAGVGTAYLQAMGVTPPLEKFIDLDPEVLGWSMASFFGGRAEARIVRTPLPVVVADFTSMYPAQNALLDTWPILTAARITVDDVTDDVRTLLTRDDLVELLFDPATWRDAVGVTLVQLDHPDQMILPVRAGFDAAASDYGIGVNPLSYDGKVWCALPDVLAAALLGDPTDIPVARPLRLRGRGQQSNLQPVELRGHRLVDPRQADNPFVAMIEERHRVARATDLNPEEKARLDQFLKITANATSYGSLARFDRRTEPAPVPVTVYGPTDEAFPDRTINPEDPGPYCFPPVAAAITAGARLMLALIERNLTDVGGSYAFMDTDSIAIVATRPGDDIACATASGDIVRALSHTQVQALLRRFETLNPFGPDVTNDEPGLGRSPWKVEHNSLSDPVWCYVIATKRYILYRDTGDGPRLVHLVDDHEESVADSDSPAGEQGTGDLVDWSEHGLGLYLDPTGKRRRDDTKHRRRLWMRDAWQWILINALTDNPPALPRWADRYALTQFTVSTPAHTGWFRVPDTGGHVAGKPRPFGFGLLGHVDPLAAHLVDAHPAGPYERRPKRWPNLAWYDRHTGQPLTTINTDELDRSSDIGQILAAGVVPLRTIADILRTYTRRPEHKSLQPDGRPADSTGTGQLQRRPVRSAPVLTSYIGKEGNRLLERATGEITDPDEYLTTYTNPAADRWRDLVLPVLRDIRDALGGKQFAREVGVSDRQVRNWFNGDVVPHAGASQHRQRTEKLALDWAVQQLRAAGHRPPADLSATLYLYETLSHQ
jgi:hypothetical protein